MSIKTKLRKLFFFCLFNLIAVIVIILLCEGLSSFTILFQEMSKTPPLAERTHTKYDAQLGWVNLPNIYIKDMYGGGIYLKTNAQGFRNNQDFNVTVPDKKIRVICSGDSFTLGYGVNNDQTWCQLLSSIDNRLQTVNMGQGGYGIDQAYLWYKRDGVKLEHNIQLFAFITADFDRMKHANFLGYGKPVLRVENDKLVIDNLPVPRRSFYLPWLTQNSGAIKELKSVTLLSRLFQSSNSSETVSEQVIENTNPEPVAFKILKELQQINQSKNSTLILVYLPTLGDYDKTISGNTDELRQSVGQAAQEANIPFFDLIDDFRKIPIEQAQTLFIQEGEVDYPGAIGHYSVKGNEHFVQILYDKLLSIPQLSANFADDK